MIDSLFVYAGFALMAAGLLSLFDRYAFLESEREMLPQFRPAD